MGGGVGVGIVVVGVGVVVRVGVVVGVVVVGVVVLRGAGALRLKWRLLLVKEILLCCRFATRLLMASAGCGPTGTLLSLCITSLAV